MNDIMLDLETLGRSPGCVFHEIAAIPFDITNGQEGGSFFRTIDIRSAKRAGLTVDEETLKWWHQKGGPMQADAVGMFAGLPDFLDFLKEQAPLRVWTWGIDFDLPILKAGLQSIGLAWPLRYWKSRDARTVYDCAYPGSRHFQKMEHSAIEDCRNQIGQLRASLIKLKSPLIK